MTAASGGHGQAQAPAPDGLAIDAAGLTKSYRGTQVLTGVDLRVPRGSVFALLGPNGAGKTTTVRILATLTRPDGGQARVAGFGIAGQRAEVRRRISLTGQYAALDELLTGTENLVMLGRLRGLTARAARDRAAVLLDEFGLADAAGRRAGKYSGGMRRRLDLAASLIIAPEVIFLDEPTTGLDPRSRQAVWAMVTAQARAGVTVLLTTQYLEEADQLADRIAVIDHGVIVAEGSPAELKDQVSGQRLELVMTDQDGFAQAAGVLGDRVSHASPAALILSVRTDGSAAHVRAVLDEVDPGRSLIRSFGVRAASLDDVFMALTGHPAKPAAGDDNGTGNGNGELEATAHV
jgi:ABC-2 type transport system ATP-binding protein